MCITEFNDELYAAQRLEEGIEIGRKQGLEQGRKQGLEEGRIEEKKATAEKLCRKGWSVEEIAEFTGVPVVDVEIWLNSK